MIDFYRRALKKLDKLDIEQRKDILVSAAAEIELLETVLDSINTGLLVCDEKNALVLVNKYAKKFLPVEKIAELIKDSLESGEKITDKEIDVDFNGGNILLSVNIFPLVQDKKIKGTLVSIEDITEKRKTEARLRRAENLASLTTLAAGVAHEIKNPLGSISIHLQLLKKALEKSGKTDEKTEKHINVIKEEVDRLNGTIIDFLFAVRPLALELRESDINKIISQTMEFVKIEMSQSNIVCMAELDENIPNMLVDERLIKQVLLNLVKNAQAAMPKGGVLTIATNYSDNEIKISVCDTGIGIKKENLTKIFEPYFTTSESGTGLGLTFVYKIIREHQGEITVDSAPDTGTEFKIILPVPQKETRLLSYEERKE